MQFRIAHELQNPEAILERKLVNVY